MNRIGRRCIPVLLGLVALSLAEDKMPLSEGTRMDMYSSVCASEEHGSLLADPFDCEQFIQCDHGKAAVRKCSPGLNFDSVLKVCNWPNEAKCATRPGSNNPTIVPDGPIRCYGYDTLHFIADSKDCEKYFICANGIAYQHQCAPGIHWDYLNNQCESPAKATCAGKSDNNLVDGTSTSSNPGTPDTTTTTPVPTTTTTRTTPEVDTLPDCTTGQKFFGCHDSCSEYYVCVNNVAYRAKCADGYYWNEESMRCDVPELSRCIRPVN